jgi:hypothetical protein
MNIDMLNVFHTVPKTAITQKVYSLLFKNDNCGVKKLSLLRAEKSKLC